MILISESCCGRQRASLKTVIHSRVCFIAAYVECKQRGNFASLLHISIAIFHGRWITLSFLAHGYVYDLRLIVFKFKVIP